ncbi:tenascin-X-like isoform X1 [Anoplopoma fimbria]|uniref:tenascin-X-like isoform X1 n=1 Tax=Anoplopoma fimbria TaxID=229290 RepID=UPI0023ECDD1E|nr:tenascin-X-like isoform X1 [Anoplopoma fimbria]
MKPVLLSSVSLWTLLVFSAVLKISRAECHSSRCGSNEAKILTTTTNVMLESTTNCSISIGNNVPAEGSITGLTPGTTYEIFLQCFNCCQTATTKPEVVRNLTFIEITTSSISLMWIKPEGSSSFYRVQWTDGTTNWNVSVTETKRNITELTAGVLYNFTVIAVAGDNKTESDVSEAFHHTKPEVVRNLTFTEITTSSISLMWTKPEGSSSFYRVQWTDGTTNWNVSVTETKRNITELTAGVLYNFTVIAVAGDNKTESDVSEAFHHTKPEVVRNLTFTEITTSSISLMWTKPEGSSSFYRVQWTDGTTNWNVSVTETKRNITELTAGVLYNFTVIAVAGDNKTESDVSEAFHHTKPEVVRNLTFTEITTSSISLMWIKPEGSSSSYIVKWAGGNVTDSKNVTQTNITITNLTAGVQYQITVTAVADDGLTEGDKATVSQYTKPAAVRNLTVGGITTSSISVMWTKPEGSSSFYRVQWTDGTTNWNVSVTETKRNITELTAGVLYNFTVIAVAGDDKTESDVSEAFHHTKPEVVRNLTFTEITTSSISLMWIKPEGSRSFYRVKWAGGNVTDSKNMTQTNITITNLTAGVQYQITVTAVADDGLTEGEKATVSQYTKPAAVRNLTVGGITTSSISVMWTKPEGSSSFYRVQWTDGTTNWNVSVTETKRNITELTAGVLYNFTVIAVAGDDKTESDVSEAFHHTKPEVVRNLTFTEITTSSISLMWIKPEGSRSFYRVKWAGGNVTDSKNMTQTNITITNLTAGVQYQITVTAVADDGLTEGEKATVSQYTKPAAVRNLTVGGITTSSISVMWTKPEGSSSFYRVQWTDGTTNWNVSVTETKRNITELTAGVLYNFTVIAVAGDDKTESDVSEAFHHTKPEVVRNLTFTEITTSSISLMWIKPEGSSSFYRVKWAGGNVTDSKNVNQTNITITNLTADVQYEITVTAVTNDGITDGQSTTVSQYTRPNPVLNLAASPESTTSIKVSWSDPPEAKSYYKYLVTYSATGALFNTTVSNNSTDVTNLEPGTRYSINVTTIAAEGSESMVEQTFSYTRPEKPEDIRITARGTNYLNISWTLPSGGVDHYVVEISNDRQIYLYSNTTQNTTALFTDLHPGRVFFITVTAVAGTFTEMSNQFSFATEPTPPGFIIIISQGNDSLHLQWATPVLMEGAPNISYYITYQPEGGEVKNTSALVNTTELLSLSSGTSYNIAVETVGPQNLRSTVTHNSTFTRPNPVLNLAASPESTTSIKVSWSDPPEAKSYYKYLVTYSATGALFNTTVSNNSIDVTNLEPGTRYSINVTTIAAEGSESMVEQTFSYTRPNPVLNLAAIPESTTSIKVSWSDPPDAKSYYKYLVTYSATGALFSITVSNNSIDVTNLEPGTRYSINVTTIAAEGSESMVEQTFSYTMPKAVANLKVEDVNTTSIRLTWARQSDHKLSYSYLVKAIQDAIVVQDNSTETETYTFFHLTPGKLYTFEVFTVVEGVKSTMESTQSYTKPEAVSDIMAIGSTTTMSVSWTSAVGQVVSYIVLLYRNSLLVGNSTDLSNATLNTQFQNLTPGVLYCVKVFAKSGPFENVNSSVWNATFPNPPGPIMVESQNETSINFTWTSPEGMDLNQYNFSVSNLTSSFLIGNNWFLLNHLQSGSPYNISVVTVGVWSYESTAVTTENYTRPYPVTMLRQTEITTNAVTLKWEQHESKSDYSYLVETTNGSFSRSNKVLNKHQNITGLLSGSNYSFTVTTQTADGTQAAPVTVSYFTRPYSIGQLDSEAINTTAVRLSWTKPLEYKTEYTYRVKTTGCGSQNKTLAGEVTVISELTPGTNCTFCVFVMAPNGIEGEDSCTSQYTKPEAVQANISSEGSNSSILVSWTKPLGKVERYKVQLNSTSREVVIMDSTNISFANLSAGRLYTAVVTTYSGPFNASSGPITNATFPNPPGSIDILMKTPSSIDISWKEASLMMGATFHYKLTIQSTQGEEYTTTTNTSHTFTSLHSGTFYNFSVATVGQMGFESEKIPINMVATRPFSVKSLRASTEEKIIKVMWAEPDQYKESYQYNLTWQSSDESMSDIIKENTYDIDNLVPGTQYNITVTTETADGTEGAPRRISKCTNASPVKNLKCEGPNTTNAQIILFWDKPTGQHSGFKVTVNSGKIINLTSTYCNTTVLDLRHKTEYNLSVETTSCGQPSTPVSLLCWTGITDPPIPENYMSSVLVSTIAHNKFTLQIENHLLDNINGPITHIGVLVTNTPPGDTSDLTKYVGKTYKQSEKKETLVYMATVVNNTIQSRSGMSHQNIEIGDGSQWQGYTNGLLKANGKYQYAIVLFTRLTLKDGLVNREASLLNSTNFYSAFTLPQDPAVISTAIGASLGTFCVLVIILIGFIIYWKRLSNKESPDIQINSMRAKV